MTLFNEFADLFESHSKAHLKPATVQLYSHVLSKNLRPNFGNSELNDVARKNVLDLHMSMEDTPVIANRTLAVGKRMYNFAWEVGVLDYQINPFSHIRFYRERHRDRFLSSEEYERLGCVLNQLESEGRFSPVAVAGIRLLILTGARRSEMETVKWDQVDFENSEIRLPDSKTGPRSIEISSPVRQVLESIPVSGEFVIAGRNGTRVGLRRVWNEARRRAGIEDVRMHDLRHSYATHAALDGVAMSVIAQLLGHTTVWTTTRYLHVSRGYASKAAEQVSRSLTMSMVK